MENNDTPLLLLDLNVTDAAPRNPRFTLVAAEEPGVVAVDAASGRVFLVASLDRETKDRYHFKVRLKESIRKCKDARNNRRKKEEKGEQGKSKEKEDGRL